MIEPIAIGKCGMSAREFDEATPREVQWRVDAMHENNNRELRNVAQHAAWILSMFSKDPIVVSDLVKLPGDDQAQAFNWGSWMKG